jgi:hypothetical protein
MTIARSSRWYALIIRVIMLRNTDDDANADDDAVDIGWILVPIHWKYRYGQLSGRHH